MSTPQSDELLTPRQVWTMIGVSRATLYNIIKRGELMPEPPNVAMHKPPRFFRRSEVERFLAERATKAEAAAAQKAETPDGGASASN